MAEIDLRIESLSLDGDEQSDSADVLDARPAAAGEPTGRSLLAE